MKVELCNFSGQKIYPSKGKLYVRGDSKVSSLSIFSPELPLIRTVLQVFRFISSKSESLFLQRKNPRKISWTVVYRRMHKKGLAEEVAKKRSRKNVKAQVGTTTSLRRTLLGLISDVIVVARYRRCRPRLHHG